MTMKALASSNVDGTRRNLPEWEEEEEEKEEEDGVGDGVREDVHVEDVEN